MRRHVLVGVGRPACSRVGRSLAAAGPLAVLLVVLLSACATTPEPDTGPEVTGPGTEASEPDGRGDAGLQSDPTSVPGANSTDLRASLAGASAAGYLYADRPLVRLEALGWADTYELEVQIRGETLMLTANEPWLTLDPSILPEPQPAFTESQAVLVRVRAGNSAVTGPWSEVRPLQVRTLSYTLLQQLAPGETADFVMGQDDGRQDERPRHAVRLTRPFSVGETELNNRQALVLLELLLASDAAEISGLSVIDASGRTLLLLGNLALGSQYHLRPGTDSDGPPLLLVSQARGAHPLAGVTWYGARALAAAADEVLAPLPGEGTVRLPTEAEWVWSARPAPGGQTQGSTGLFPWGSRLILNNQANFFGSLDPFETIREPWGARGGPTTPIGFYRGGSRAGYPTVSGRALGGALDLIGNVWEWTLDAWNEEGFGPVLQAQALSTEADRALERDVEPDAARESDGEPDQATPQVFSLRVDPVVERGTSGPEGLNRVVRGTAWNSRRADVYPANRGSFPQGLASHSIGVRLVLELGGAAQSGASEL